MAKSLIHYLSWPEGIESNPFSPDNFHSIPTCEKGLAKVRFNENLFGQSDSSFMQAIYVYVWVQTHSWQSTS